MKENLLRILITIFYAFLGLLIALPISYFFQDGVLKVMSLTDYVINSPRLLTGINDFGAWKTYRVVASVSIVAVVILGNLFEKLLFRKKGK